MRHDFDPAHEGSQCTGIMDYGNTPNTWSSCSANDFDGYLTHIRYLCLHCIFVVSYAYIYIRFNTSMYMLYRHHNKDCLSETTEEVVADIAPDVNEQCRTRFNPQSKYCLQSSVQEVCT